MTALEIAQKPQAVERFLDGIEESRPDPEERELRLEEIHGLIRFAQRFFVAFFLEEVGEPLPIRGFGYRDKRRVGPRLIELEAERKRADPPPDPKRDPKGVTVELGGYFEELVDSLQGELEFGYSEYLDDFAEFHNELYPGWLELLGVWCFLKDDPEAEATLIDLASRYRDVAQL